MLSDADRRQRRSAGEACFHRLRLCVSSGTIDSRPSVNVELRLRYGGMNQALPNVEKPIQSAQRVRRKYRHRPRWIANRRMAKCVGNAIWNDDATAAWYPPRYRVRMIAAAEDDDWTPP